MHVEIEATNECNTRCLHCPHESVTRPRGKMSWETFQTLTGKVFACASPVSVEFAGMGEPLLNPDIYRFVASISAQATTSLTTNAAALTGRNTVRLIDAGLDRLTISFNGADQASYELMMGGLEFVRAAAHLHRAVAMTRGTRTQVAVNVSVTKPLQNQLPQLRAYLRDAGVERIFFSLCHNRGGNLDDPTVCDTPPPPFEDGRCDIFNSTLFVAWNGEVLSCCHDLHGENGLGNLNTTDLADILRQRERIAAQGVFFRICKGCNDMYRYMHVPPPGGTPLAEWIYYLYARTEPQAEFLINQIRDLETRLAEKDRALEQRDAELRAIHASRAWRLMRRLQRIRAMVAPRGSRWERWLRGLLDRTVV